VFDGVQAATIPLNKIREATVKKICRMVAGPGNYETCKSFASDPAILQIVPDTLSIRTTINTH
jgi:hypothetical protein